MNKWLILLVCLISILHSCSSKDHIEEITGIRWTWLDNGQQELASMRLVYEESFGEGNNLRLNQSMSIWKDRAFCFNDGNECKVLNINGKSWLMTDKLPEYSHNNNVQFLNAYYDVNDKYPLMLLSRGDYPPNQNEVYIVRVQDINGIMTFSIVKTIYNTISEASYNGSWVVDEEHQLLYLYTMTSGDFRVIDDNYFCIFSFPLPDISKSENVVLGYDSVVSKWEYPYLILQGGAYYNGYLLFNVESMDTYQGKNIASGRDVILINQQNGMIEAILPLNEGKETEGICVYNDKLYVSFKNGYPNQGSEDICFSIREYTLPSKILK